MFTDLLESRRPHERSAAGLMPSLLAHAAIISAAVLLAPHDADGRSPARESSGQPIWIEPAPREMASEAGAPTIPSRSPASPTEIVLPPMEAPAEVPVGVPPVTELPGPPWDDVLRELERGGRRGDGTAAQHTGKSGGSGRQSYLAHEVDKPVVALPGSRPPDYPERLRSGGVEGRVVVRFVVDTTGRLRPTSIQVLSSTHDEFTDAVLAALPRFSFLPAVAGGRQVPQLVELPFDFSLER